MDDSEIQNSPDPNQNIGKLSKNILKVHTKHLKRVLAGFDYNYHILDEISFLIFRKPWF